MRLTTVKQNFGKEVLIFDSKSLKFSNDGICEVNDKFGKELLERYGGIFFDADSFKEVKVVDNPAQDNFVKNLEKEILDLKSNIESLKSEKNIAIADKEEWAKLAENKEKELNEFKAKDNEELKSMENELKFFKFKITLMESNKEHLRNLCSKSGFPQEEWDKLNVKDLVEYILNKS